MHKPIKVLMLCFFSLFAFSLLCFVPDLRGQTKISDYVGAEACKDCHPDYFTSYAKTIHAKKAIPGSPGAGAACESCHGPGGKHVADGGGKGSIVSFNRQESPAKKAAMCLACHDSTQELTFWDMGKHKTMGVSCDVCHTAHSPTMYVRHSLKAPESVLCLPCHKDVRSQMMRQSRHPIQEGKIKCSDCHAVHGGFGPKMIKADSDTDLCYKCHTEKRGPFAFEHPPVAENCATCHQAHGSNHTNLLKSRVPQLCQACHDTGLGHNSLALTGQHGFMGNATANKNRFFAQGCLNCHGNIHGSNRSPTFER